MLLRYLPWCKSAKKNQTWENVGNCHRFDFSQFPVRRVSRPFVSLSLSCHFSLLKASKPISVLPVFNKHSLISSLIRENNNFIARAFQILLWKLRKNLHLFPINSFILFHNLWSQHKSFGRWSIGEQKDLSCWVNTLYNWSTSTK